MIREITFRGISVETGEWVYGYYGKLETMDGEKHFIIVPTVTFTETVSAFFTDHEVKPETVGQYTGLKDKNGVDIFEGDLLKGYDPESKEFIRPIMGVYWSNRGMWDCESFILGGMNESCEVIGNIYENPELLDGNR